MFPTNDEMPNMAQLFEQLVIANERQERVLRHYEERISQLEGQEQPRITENPVSGNQEYLGRNLKSYLNVSTLPTFGGRY